MIYTKEQEYRELSELIEDTFDLCKSNKEEIYWLICLLRTFMNIPNKRTDYNSENFNINLWQYQLHPIIERFKQRW